MDTKLFGTPESKSNSVKTNFPIVGIGASAGGLEALEQFFENMPADNGIAFVVIQHLDPDHPGIMPELLQRITNMKVYQAADKLVVKPNHVYVIPPNKSMSILNGALFLFEPIEARGLRLPIDYFFKSLANDQKENSVGVILSGMGSDGSSGLKAIKEMNGAALVQEPNNAKFDGMPRSAVNAVHADIVAPANELPAKLMAILKHIPVISSDLIADIKNTSNLEKIIILLRAQTGHDFSLYKKNTMFRRIERRMNVHQIDKIHNYVRFLQENPKEIEILFKELLIGVTNFFRDNAVWEKLKTEILPVIFAEFPNGYAFRAWVTACSTGEEAYTLAIIFKEAVEELQLDKSFSLQIFATDIEADAIELARKGEFSSNIVADVSAERISKFFHNNQNGFKIKPSIREMVVFAPQNVIKDPPFTKLDFLSCRNMLIYMESELQNKLMTLFHYSLNPGGIMLLGSAENESSGNGFFTLLDSKLKFFKRTELPKKPELLNFPSSFSQKKITITESQQKPMKEIENIQTLADRLLLQRFSPASVLINDQGDILYITGKTGKYLEPAAGKANMNIYSMAREGLNTMLTGAIRKAKQNYEPVLLKNLKIGTSGGINYVDVTIQQIEKPEALKSSIIIVFSDIIKPISENPTRKTIGKLTATSQHEIENELLRANEEIQSTREEMQTSQEELKSTNEELQSTNEELQSTNEELTTSKEEMQSLNEELQTVNAELQSKIGDFVMANNDMINLLNSTDIATLFLDKELNIRRFTEQLSKIVKLRPTDVGRPFTDLVNNLEYPDIANHAKEVLRTLVYKETAITTNSGNWFNVRIMPYRTFDDKIDGVVITFVDISVAKKLEIELSKTVELLREHNLYKS
jgi:two-component system, chemotaxis family, CheB/CheR fusion protein